MSRAIRTFWAGAGGAALLAVALGFAYEQGSVQPARRQLIAERIAAEAALRAVNQAQEALAMRLAVAQARTEALEVTVRAFPPGRVMGTMRRDGARGCLPMDETYYRLLHAAGRVPKITHEAR